MRSLHFVDITVLESMHHRSDHDDDMVLIPDKVLIDGVPVAIAADEPFIVEKIDMPAHGALKVTCTFLARSFTARPAEAGDEIIEAVIVGDDPWQETVPRDRHIDDPWRTEDEEAGR